MPRQLNPYARAFKKAPSRFGSLFIDSGAFGIYNFSVLGQFAPRLGKHGRLLEAKEIDRGRGDYWFYSLKKGSEFRKYIECYVDFCRRYLDGDNLMAVTVDAIANPQLTWEINEFIRKEYGLKLVPVVHALEPIEWVDRYLETGEYDFIGLGGIGHSMPWSEYIKWADQVFYHLCPESNGYKPIVRVHGFALTAWELIVRWPWWSVDSTTWAKQAAFGCISIPKWGKNGWRYDCPPVQLGVTKGVLFGERSRYHIDKMPRSSLHIVHRWLEECGVPEGKEGPNGEMIEYGIRSSYLPRMRVNCIYFKNLEESIPEWPFPLDSKIIEQQQFRANSTFGLAV